MPQPVTREFVVNTWRDTWQNNPDVTTLKNGNVVVVWDSLFMLDEADYQVVSAQIYRPDGTPVGGEIILSDPSLVADHARVEALEGGGFAVAWTAGPDSVLNPTDVYTATYTASGARTGPITQVNPPADNEFYAPELVAQPDGGYSVIWSRDRAAPGNDPFDASDSFVRSFSATGRPENAPVQVNVGTFGEQANMRAVQLSNGNAVVVWEHEYPGQSPFATPSDLRARLLDANGRPISPELILADETAGPNEGIALTDTDVSVAALSGGRFIATWVETVLEGQPDGDTAFRVQGRIFGPDGRPQGPMFQVNQYDGNIPDHTNVVGLANGGFAVVWDQWNDDRTDTEQEDIYLQYFSEFGARIGGNMIVNTARNNSQEWASVTALGNGGIFVAYESEYLDGDSDAVAGRVFSGLTAAQIALGGRGGAGGGSDRITGTVGNDRIAGLAGNDILSGAAGSDLLLGGAGNDQLNGGMGNDTLDGGAGIDTATYATAVAIRVNLAQGTAQITGQGTDTIMNVENIASGSGNDNLSGNAAANLLSSGAGRDTLSGAMGNDTLNGGVGADSMAGGIGHDVYWVDNGSDRVTEVLGGGTDRINATISVDLMAASRANVENVTLYGTGAHSAHGGAGANVLIGNAGANTLAGRAGHDTLSGGGGADTFLFRDGFDRDVVTDFQNNIDTIRLLDFGVANFAQARAHATQSGAHVVFDFGEGDALTIRNTTIAALADDMIFV